ncbi:MAG: helix-turn-helix domain-containing protein [Verrucomicrobia bacterium]|nr:helix-turn-helix domain-containing protein [Verrucomicrobiota bacterium]
MKELVANTTAPDDAYISKAQLAQRMGVTTRTIETWMRQRRVPYEKIGKTVRFHWGDVRNFLARQSYKTTSTHDDLRPDEGCKVRLQQLAKVIRQRNWLKADGTGSIDMPDAGEVVNNLVPARSVPEPDSSSVMS